MFWPVEAWSGIDTLGGNGWKAYRGGLQEITALLSASCVTIRIAGGTVVWGHSRVEENFRGGCGR